MSFSILPPDVTYYKPSLLVEVCLLSPLHAVCCLTPLFIYLLLKTPQSSLCTQKVLLSAVYCLQSSSQPPIIIFFLCNPILISPWCHISSCDLSLLDLSLFHVLSLCCLQVSPHSSLPDLKMLSQTACHSLSVFLPGPSLFPSVYTSASHQVFLFS